MTTDPHPLTGRDFESPVPPGSGWPEDPATPDTPAARTPAQVRRLARTDNLAELDARVSVCRACPRLVRWREQVARTRRASFADQPYWGRPIAGWGDPEPGILVVGLAPAAHGGNRTGRVFTGDSSGDWLFEALHRHGWASRPDSRSRSDGMTLTGCYVTAAARCAPPDNRPTSGELERCRGWLERELGLLPSVRVVLTLGRIGWESWLRASGWWDALGPRGRPAFGHGLETRLPDGRVLLSSFHPSRQNTNTGRLTRPMWHRVFRRARELVTTATAGRESTL